MSLKSGLNSFALGVCLWAVMSAAALADSKLLATSGGTQFEGQAGGGLVPWALIAGYGDEGEWGGAAALTHVRVSDFDLDVVGAAIGIDNRYEFSVAEQTLNVRPLDVRIRQRVIGAKARLYGDLIYGVWPAVTAGVQYKRNEDMAVPRLLGAQKAESVDVTLSASKLWLNGLLGRNVFANLTVRNTEANQTGFLGFGAPDAGRSWVGEAALAAFLSPQWVVGAEFRDKPSVLSGLREDAWRDVFVGWFPNKRFALIAAYADLGSIAGLANQTGVYVSVQVTQ